ncbi:MAG TPA: hypothetical protein VK638_25525, partial [Edaphobacter sp.]|nr:hypothetical protein [Edaphobacter sp.]
QLCVTPHHTSEIVSTPPGAGQVVRPRGARLYVRSGAITSRHLRSRRLASDLDPHALQRPETTNGSLRALSIKGLG